MINIYPKGRILPIDDVNLIAQGILERNEYFEPNVMKKADMERDARDDDATAS